MFKIFLLFATFLFIIVTIAAFIVLNNKHHKKISNSIEFPDFSKSKLTPKQVKILSILRKEWDKQPDGTKYSEGIEEPWCADFVSWVMKEFGSTFSNPHSGSWRIPGVYTLQEYFSSIGIWHDYNTYQPKTGDIVIYKDDSVFGGHTNFVLKNDDGFLTTIGGNEDKKIRIQSYKLDEKIGIKGFGELR